MVFPSPFRGSPAPVSPLCRVAHRGHQINVRISNRRVMGACLRILQEVASPRLGVPCWLRSDVWLLRYCGQGAWSLRAPNLATRSDAPASRNEKVAKPDCCIFRCWWWFDCGELIAAVVIILATVTIFSMPQNGETSTHRLYSQ